VAALKEAINNGSLETIKAAQDELEKAVYAVSEKLYKNAAPQGDPNAAGPQGNPGDNGNVYDADFKDVD